MSQDATGADTRAMTRLVIFDFDGVVVDSEPISLSTLRDTLAHFGLDLTIDAVRARFLGNSVPRIAQAIRAETGRDQPGFAAHWYDMLFARFRAELRAMPGITELLDALDRRGVAYCIASGSAYQRLDVSLEVTGLAPRFAGRVFSADLVLRGKPAPDLFLLAAERMGVAPGECLVVEDAPAGIEAARAAGMRALGFVGGGHLAALAQSHGVLLTERGAERVLTALDEVTASL
ncbi:HAD family hydrolase [Paracoccus sp. NSM]|uniref:HAD family hydrolase n=1 Tax=Paracoccus sp. NSM TaxID=3457784 RepID=UPI004035A0A1